jgi:hypothetical protein
MVRLLSLVYGDTIADSYRIVKLSVAGNHAVFIGTKIIIPHRHHAGLDRRYGCRGIVAWHTIRSGTTIVARGIALVAVAIEGCTIATHLGTNHGTGDGCCHVTGATSYLVTNDPTHDPTQYSAKVISVGESRQSGEGYDGENFLGHGGYSFLLVWYIVAHSCRIVKRKMKRGSDQGLALQRTGRGSPPCGLQALGSFYFLLEV